MDDPSRLIPFAAYYPQANTEAFHHARKEAILRRGLPRKLYTDQGQPFVSSHTGMVVAVHAVPWRLEVDVSLLEG